jgi:3-methyladenine DNA glycosylase AlkD
MNVQEALDTLKSLGTEQNRKVYRRHGAAEDLYGVSYADLKNLKKKIKVDHDLAEGLWAGSNHDGRILGAMVADPKRMDGDALDRWAQRLRSRPETDAFADVAAASPTACEALERWIESDEEWTASTGWKVLARLAMNDPSLPDEYFERLLARIEKDLQSERNWVRYEMNNALIAIGIRNPNLEKQAVAAAGRIGKVIVDHGETGCKTPDATPYIRKAVERKKKSSPPHRVLDRLEAHRVPDGQEGEGDQERRETLRL